MYSSIDGCIVECDDERADRDVYSHNTVACGDTATGSVDVRTQTTLVFTQCEGKPPNPGERSIEKIHIDDSPDRGDFKFQFNGQINKR